MTGQLNKLEENRKLLLSQTEHLSAEQYNFIPEGSNNNIIWNMGHMLLVGDGVLYRLSPGHRPGYAFDNTNYVKGSKPDGKTTINEIYHIRQLLAETVNSYKAATGIERQSDLIESGTEVAVQPISAESLQSLLLHEDKHRSKISWLLQKVTIKIPQKN